MDHYERLIVVRVSDDRDEPPRFWRSSHRQSKWVEQIERATIYHIRYHAEEAAARTGGVVAEREQYQAPTARDLLRPLLASPLSAEANRALAEQLRKIAEECDRKADGGEDP